MVLRVKQIVFVGGETRVSVYKGKTRTLLMEGRTDISLRLFLVLPCSDGVNAEASDGD